MLFLYYFYWGNTVTCDLIGFLAASIGAAFFLRQVFLIFKIKDTKTLSRHIFSLIKMNNLLGLMYAILINNIVLKLSQFYVFPMSLVILFYKLKYL